MRAFRWKAVVPMLLAAALLAVAWLLYVDVAIRRTVELVGTELVGARVELASARLRLSRADLVLRGLQVADPNAPMRNLVEIPEIVADLNGRALLDKKVVIETLAVRGVRFGTPRATSGAVRRPSPSTGLVTRRVLDWAEQVPVPTLDLSGLAGTVVRTDAISPDSLRSLSRARAARAAGDSLRAAWDQGLRGLEPQPLIDSARALVSRLQEIDVRRANPVQVTASANAARQLAQRITDMQGRVASLRASVDSGVTAMRGLVSGLDSARRADYAYARGLLNIPALDAPDISMALFGRMAAERLKPVLYWVGLAEQHLPPGLDPRRNSGPRRARLAGTTYTFPRLRTWPALLVERAEADLAIGGETVAAGEYFARIAGATTEPAVYGRPMRFAAGRTSEVGPRDLRVGGTMDRTADTPRDSLSAFIPSVEIPRASIPAAGGELEFGATAIEVALARAGSSLSGTYRMTSDAAGWIRTGDTASAATAPVGSSAWAEGVLWRSLSSVRRVTIEIRISGELASPRFAISSNVGDAVSASLRQAVGEEIRRAEARARAEVDRLVGEQVSGARAQVAEFETRVAQRLSTQQEQLGQLRQEIDQQVQRITSGIRLPGGIRLPRP